MGLRGAGRMSRSSFRMAPEGHSLLDHSSHNDLSEMHRPGAHTCMCMCVFCLPECVSVLTAFITGRG